MNRDFINTTLSLKKTLRAITDILLAPLPDYKGIREACASLLAFFCDVSGFDINEGENQLHINTDAGLAVSPYAAAFCITDMLRTRGFLQGIKEAIDAKLGENPGRPVMVLYAGTGPFATLVTPLTTVYTPEQLQLVLLDINPISIAHLQKIIRRMDLQPYIIDMVQADALTFLIPGKYKPDIIISETMKPGLQKEPQVSVVANLLSQCNRNTVLIPSLVKVEACLAGNRANNNHELNHLRTLIELDAVNALRIKNNPEDVPVISEGLTIAITERPAPDFTQLILATSIHIFNDHWLRFNETSLTIRHPVMNIATIEHFPVYLLFRYIMTDEPGFRMSVLLENE
jgi:predicted RNA methylase